VFDDVASTMPFVSLYGKGWDGCTALAPSWDIVWLKKPGFDMRFTS
jgi:hypothetical protein